MGQLMGAALGGTTAQIIILVVIVAIALFFRVYLVRRGGGRAKCPKCGEVFDASRSYSLINIGTTRQIKCPACGKTSFMKTGVKEPITWPRNEEKPKQPPDRRLSEEELENKRIEESKYETT